jgi:hypothetical protein
MMKSIIGLIRCEAADCPVVERLKEAGIAGERISIISNPNTINALLGCDPGCVIRNYTTWGIAVGTVIYAIFGAAAALCQCNIMKYGQEYGIGAFLGAVLAGAFVGALIGILVGAGEAEKDTHLYLQWIRQGGKVITIRTLEEDTEFVKHTLALENVTGVKALQLEGT